MRENISSTHRSQSFFCKLVRMTRPMETPARLPEMWARYERGGMEEEGAS